MKKAFFSSLALCLATMSLQAQESNGKKESRIYIRLGGTYAFSHAGDVMSGTSTSTSTYSGTTLISASESYDLKKGSYGAGISGVLAGGVMFSKHFGVELAVGVGISPKKHTGESTMTETGSSPTYTYQSKSKTTSYQKMPVLIMPSIVMQTGGNNINGYTRIGVALPVAGKLVQESKVTESNGGPTTFGTEWDVEMKTRFAVGLQGALGVQLKLDNKFAIYVEVNGVSMNAYAKKASVTKYSEDGVDHLGDLNVAQKETEFEKDYSQTNVGASDPNAASKQPTFALPMSNIGVGAGIVLSL